MKIVTPEEMRRLDRVAIEKYGTPSLTLMERAGEGVAAYLAEHFSSAEQVGVLIGKGNNGGDGLVAARSLLKKGIALSIFFLTEPSSCSPDAQENWKRLQPLKPDTVHLWKGLSEKEIESQLKRCSLFVDALFGTGLSKKLEGLAAQIVHLVNASRRPVMAVDIPSGIDGESGVILGTAIRATTTVTLGLPKKGLFQGEGAALSGQIHVVDIGIPEEEMKQIATPWEMITPDLFPSLLLPRQRDSHKGTYGHALIFSGTDGMLGAGYLSSIGALRVGCGLVTYALPVGAFEKFDARYPEVICSPVPDGGTKAFHPDGISTALALVSGKQSVAVGPGIGTSSLTAQFVKEIVTKVELPLVIDADALNCLVNHLDPLKERRAPTILTPHPGEMSRLTGKTKEEIQRDRIGIAQSFAKTSRVYLVLKGNKTVVATPEGRIFLNPTGNPGMASAGMGDALTGVIVGFLAQGASAEEAALGGVYLHGLAADVAAREGEAGLVATDLIAALPAARERLIRKSAT